MNIPAADSAIDIAYWFLNKAEDAGIYLDDEQIHNLLFLSQVHYALQNRQEVLMPSLFLCGEDGIIEPALHRIFSQGRPFMPPIKLNDKLTVFLNGIWDKYGTLPAQRLKELIKKSAAYKDHCIAGSKNIINISQVIEKFTNLDNKASGNFRKKVLISQNGPVMVSQWNPRKLDTSSKGTQK